MTIFFFSLLLLVMNPCCGSSADFMPENQQTQLVDSQPFIPNRKTVKNIIIVGNTLVPVNALKAKIPFYENGPFDPSLTRKLIENVHDLGYYNSVEVQGEDVNDKEMNLYIILREKKKLDDIIYEGNKHLTKDEIEKKYNFSEIRAVDEQELVQLADQIKSLYAEKNYHSVSIETELQTTDRNTVIAVFKIDEGRPSIVKRVYFKGNKSFSSKKLRSMIFTREDWILGFLDKAGSYQPDALEYDKHVIENFYQSNGFLTARVTQIAADKDPVDPYCITITFTVDEGDLYTIRCVNAPGNSILSEPALLSVIPIRPGQLYSRELIRKSIEVLRLAWGRYGYIYADIDPAVQPDHESRTVDITFYSELGSQVFLNRLSIIGNQKTKDYVIRRVTTLTEGELITQQAMDESKANVEMLGYFDPRDGVNWQTTKIDENTADLDLILKEVKTGKLFAQIGFGGSDKDPKSPTSALKLSAGLGDRNFLGTGLTYNLALTYSGEDRGVVFNVGNPWLFGRPISGSLDAYVRKTTYEDFKNLEHIPVENKAGFAGYLGFAPGDYINTRIMAFGGIERIRYQNEISVMRTGLTPEAQIALESRFRRQFQPGTYSWVGGSVGQDLRNHPVFPNRGYVWSLNTKSGIPFKSNYGFVKFEADGSWLTPLIGDYDLVFLIHGHAGFVKAINGHNIPYPELFHLGGPATVRGFLWGQIGPSAFGDSLGGTKAFWINSELIFNVTQDMKTKAVLFYDGGASWDTFDVTPGLAPFIRNNRFEFRHAIGFGVRLTSPAPIKIDWAFKLDRNKKRGEPASEVHFTMQQDF